MTELKQKINIVKILNLPVTNNKEAEVEVNMQLDLDDGFYRCDISESIEKLINDKQIVLDSEYKTTALYAIDDCGEKYTLFDFDYMYKKSEYGCKYLSIIYYSILYNAHIESWDGLQIKKVVTLGKCKKTIGLDFDYNNIHINTEPQHSRENMIKEDLDFMGDDYPGQYTGVLKITLDGNQTFKKAEDLLWRLSEFFLLIYEDTFFGDKFDLYSIDREYQIKSYKRANTLELRRERLRTKNIHCVGYCRPPLDDLANNFAKFIDFRENSGIIFDVFRSTVYSKSFREDYPLRLSQAMEGLANYLKIADTLHKKDTFKSAIRTSLYRNDYIKEYLPNDADVTEFLENIDKHRNIFSHVKNKKDYLQGDENERYAEILYSTIRVLIMKHLKGGL